MHGKYNMMKYINKIKKVAFTQNIVILMQCGTLETCRLGMPISTTHIFLDLTVLVIMRLKQILPSIWNFRTFHGRTHIARDCTEVKISYTLNRSNNKIAKNSYKPNICTLTEGNVRGQCNVSIAVLTKHHKFTYQ